MTAGEVAALVTMPHLLVALDLDANERTHRLRCPLCGSKNPTAFSWREDGLWHCFRCGAGGDKFTLVRRLLGCDFRKALQFLASLAGVEAGSNSQAEVERAKRERERLDGAVAWLMGVECRALDAVRGAIASLEQLRTQASHRLGQLMRGEPELFPAEAESRWDDLAVSELDLPKWNVAYHIIAFGSTPIRLQFLLHREAREKLIERVLLVEGFVCDDGYFQEVPYA